MQRNVFSRLLDERRQVRPDQQRRVLAPDEIERVLTMRRKVAWQQWVPTLLHRGLILHHDLGKPELRLVGCLLRAGDCPRSLDGPLLVDHRVVDRLQERSHVECEARSSSSIGGSTPVRWTSSIFWWRSRMASSSRLDLLQFSEPSLTVAFARQCGPDDSVDLSPTEWST